MPQRPFLRHAPAAAVPRAALAALTVCLALAGVARAGQPEPDGAEPLDARVEEVVVVEGRLVAGPAATPSSTSADEITRADLDLTRPRSAAEWLAPLAIVNAADETGNGHQLSLELRGFAGSQGATAVTLDGLRINEPDTNTMSWELVRLEDLERVEIQPGPRAALGGGSLAGVIHLQRRRAPDTPAADVALTLGTFGLSDLRAFGGGKVGRVRLGASGSRVRDDGFRDGALTEEDAGRLAIGGEAGPVSLDLDWSHVQGRWRQPGALTKDEWDADPSDSSHNVLDAQDLTSDLVTLRAERAQAPRTSWVAIAGLRRRDSAILTSGRSCYGFTTDDQTRSLSAAFEASTHLGSSQRLSLRWGAEAQRDRLSPEGSATDDTCDGEVHARDEWSSTRLAWNRLGVFTGLDASLPRGLALQAGLRHDASDVERSGREMSFDTGLLEATEGSASFSGTKGTLGLARRHDGARLDFTWRARYEQSFLAPSATQLFAYPGYFSNPALSPQEGQGPTLGAEWEASSWSALAEVYQVDVDDEIVYDESARKNENVGRTRRRGLRARVIAEAAPRLRVVLDAVFTDATLRASWGAGGQSGRRVPLVPRHDVTLALDIEAGADTAVRVALRSIGRAALSDDFDGSAPELAGHEVIDVFTRTLLPGRARLALGLSLTNLLDERHATRGIEAPGGPYFTPAAPRAVSFTISHRL